MFGNDQFGSPLKWCIKKWNKIQTVPTLKTLKNLKDPKKLKDPKTLNGVRDPKKPKRFNPYDNNNTKM